MGSKKQNRKYFHQKNLEKPPKKSRAVGRRTAAQELRFFNHVPTGALRPADFFSRWGTGNRKKHKPGFYQQPFYVSICIHGDIILLTSGDHMGILPSLPVL
jgi:hypothetical protein